MPQFELNEKLKIIHVAENMKLFVIDKIVYPLSFLSASRQKQKQTGFSVFDYAELPGRTRNS